MNDTPVLIAREGQLAGERWPIDEEEFVIGRGAECQIVLPERQVSRYHAKIMRELNRYVLYDLDSKNGTHLNGVHVKGSAPLRDGDEIQIALCVKLLFIGTDATIPLTVEEIVPKGNLELDKQQRSVIIDGKYLDPPLSLAQFRLLETLYDAAGAVVGRVPAPVGEGHGRAVDPDPGTLLPLVGEPDPGVIAGVGEDEVVFRLDLLAQLIRRRLGEGRLGIAIERHTGQTLTEQFLQAVNQHVAARLGDIQKCHISGNGLRPRR